MSVSAAESAAESEITPRSPNRSTVALCFACAITIAVFWLLAAASAAADVLVIDVGPGSSVVGNELAAGDRLTGWAAGPGPFQLLDHPLTLSSVLLTDGRVHPLRLRVVREGASVEIDLPVGETGLATAPYPHPIADDVRDQVAAVLAGEEDAEKDEDEISTAIDLWLGSVDRPGSMRDACWARLRLIQMLVDSQRPASAIDIARGLESTCKTDIVEDTPVALDAAAQAVQARTQDIEAVRDLWNRAIAAAEPVPDSALLRASLHHNRGSFLGRRGRLDDATVDLERAAELFESSSGGNAWGRSQTLANLGIIAGIRGDLEGARAKFEEALSVATRMAPESGFAANQHSNLGVTLRQIGEFDEARRHQERALEIQQRLAPDSEAVARALNNLGVVAKRQGDLIAAEAYYREALAVREALESPPLARAAVLGNLANLALERLDPGASLALHQRVLDLLEPVAPGHRYIATTLHSLGIGELLRGRVDLARSHLERALAVQHEIGTETEMYAAILEALGLLEAEVGNTDSAREYLEQALVLLREIDPGRLDIAAVGLHLAKLDESEGRAGEALSRYEDAARLAEQRAPGSLTEARARFGMAGLLWQSQRRTEALSEHARALDAFERQRERLGGDWLQRMRFGAEFSELYVTFVERLLDADDIVAAFVVQERYRAYERRRLLSGRIPLPDLGSPADDISVLVDRVSPGTALLSYLVGPEHLIVFTLRSDAQPSITAKRVEVSGSELAEAIESLRLLISVNDASDAQRAARRQRAAALHSMLIEPVRERLEGVRRLVVVADHELHQLPFSALVDAETGAYLIERFPLAYAASATVYAYAPTASRAVAPRVLAVADPLPEASSSAPVRGSASQRLDAARGEVEAIARMFGAGTQTLVGAEATERNVRNLLVGSDVLHFATHADVDSARPLDAFVQLRGSATDEGTENDGRLAAWEVLSQLEIDSFLVTLSACRTALGRTLGGDGVLGLSQAFLLSGASNVVATLWEVPDKSTARLMERFYAGLRAGRAVDVALQMAQVAEIDRQRDLIQPGRLRRILHRWQGQSGRALGPLEWAAFKVEGGTSSAID